MVLYYHFRYTNTKDFQLKMVDELIKHLKPTLYAFGSEVSKEGVPHCHGHLELADSMDIPTDKDRKSRWYKKLRTAIGAKATPSDIHLLPLEKPRKNNLLYILKGLDIIKHNLPQEEYDELIEETIEINEDKKIDIKDKLLNEVKKLLPNYSRKRLLKDHDDGTEILVEEIHITLADIADIIDDTYITKYNKLPPNRGLMYQYVMFISKQLNICSEERYRVLEKIF